MTTELSTTPPTPSNSSPPRNDDFSSLHMAMTLRDVAQRLSSVEEKLDSRDASPRKGRLLEFSRVVFGGWPAFGFLFILLFYSPLKEALNAIPEKVKAADEIGVLGVSLKSTIKVEAAKLGELKLSETIPSLSNAAIEFLLRAPRTGESLVSYVSNDQKQVIEVNLPNPVVVSALSELQGQGLIQIETWKDGEKERQLTGPELREFLENFRKQHPGTESNSFTERQTTWVPNRPLSERREVPNLMWRLSELGQKGVNVILNAVSTELAPKSQPAK